jgi:anaerobic magnesium-protoporphyrin IX monomethyl ester cyclase
MKLLFIYNDIKTGQYLHFQHGIGSISSVLKQGGHSTSLLYLSQEISQEELIRRVEKLKPDLIGFSTGTHQWRFVREYSRWLKDSLKLPIICGGIHPTLAPEEVISEPGIDMLCRGEGEHVLLELANNMEEGKDITQIQNLWIKGPRDDIIKNPLRPLIPDLDSLPFPDRDLYDYGNLLKENAYEHMLMASRGCPYRCSYCCSPALNQLYSGKGPPVRTRSPQNVIEELTMLQYKYRVESFFFMDETFTLNHRWLSEFCQLYQGRFIKPFKVFVRVETVNEEILRLLKETGCSTLLIGVESGNEEIRRKIMNRGMKNEDIIRVFQMADKIGIKTWNFNLLGVPGETKETIQETIDLNIKISPDHIQNSVFFPYPGTELYNLCEREGYLTGEERTSYFDDRPVINLPTISREEIQRYFGDFRQLAFLLQARKAKLGYYDFISNFELARVNSEDSAYVKLALIRILGDERLCVFAHPTTRLQYKLRLKPDSVLRFGIALSPLVWSPEKGGGTKFTITASNLLKEKPVFSKFIDPKNDPEDRIWHDFELDLSNLRGKNIKLNFITSTQEGKNSYCWAIWSRPHLVQKSKAG